MFAGGELDCSCERGDGCGGQAAELPLQGDIEGGVGNELDQPSGLQVICDEVFGVHAPCKAGPAGIYKAVC